MITYAEAVTLTARLLGDAGMAPADADRAGRALATADAWGIGSHGLMRLPHYLHRIAAGGIDPAATLRAVTPSRADDRATADTPGPVLAYDGGHGLGHPQLWAAAEECARRCAAHGIAAVSVGDSSHCGALGYYVLPALQRGLLALAFSDGPAAMAPWGGHRAVLSTSPLAAGVPGRPEPVIVDMASTTVARGKVAAHARTGEPLPAGWAVDAGGLPTTDPAAAMAGMLAPLGGAKGFALGLLVESLTAGLTGPALSAQVPDMFDRGCDARPQRISHLVITLDPARFDVDGRGADRLADLAGLIGAAGGRLPGAGRSPLREIPGDTPLAVPADLMSELLAWPGGS